MEEKIIIICESFSRTPGPREKKEGPFSGELFRETILSPAFAEAIEKDYCIVVDLDGTTGYGTSFLEEVFGGLVREYSKEEVKKRIKIISEEEDYLHADIEEYIEEADKK